MRINLYKHMWNYSIKVFDTIINVIIIIIIIVIITIIIIWGTGTRTQS